MLSMTLPPIDGTDIGKHPMVSKLMKGIFNKNPPKPNSTWDVDRVLTCVAKIPSEARPLILSCKTAIIMALATFMRISELASIELKSVNVTESGASFSLLNLRKAQRSGPLASFSIKRLPESAANVCPVATLQSYLELTSHRRSAQNSSHLFIGAVRPFLPVSSSTIGRWIKQILKDSGVDTAVFSAHSTRGAAASKAAAKDVPTDSILRSGSWASESTFATFYRREIPHENVGSSVMEAHEILSA